MSGSFRVETPHEDVWIVSPIGGSSPPDGAAALTGGWACYHLGSWFADAERSRPVLLAIVSHLEAYLVPRSFVSTSWLLDRVAYALREGWLTAYARPKAGPAADVAADKASAPPPPPPAPPPEPKTWIALQLQNQADSSPVAGARYTLKLPDGSTQSGSLDAKGQARVDGILAGDCDVDFPDFAPKEWGATPVDGGGFDYTIQQGDCLASIAKQFRFADWHTIYDAPENAAFKTLRPDPNLVFPGDSLHIPGKQAEPVSRPTGATHTFQLSSTQTRFKVRISFGVPFTYHLDIAGATWDGKLDDGGVIDVPIDHDAAGGKISIWPNSDMDQDPLERSFKLGALDPVTEVSGVQARLDNLGFDSGGVDGIAGPVTGQAVRGFQDAFGLPVTGELDDATRDAIKSHHDFQ
jgi:hypothetical protein